METNELSIIEKLALLPKSERDAIINSIAPTLDEKEALLYNYKFLARPKQYLPLDNNDYFIYSILAGRGFGKTWTGSKALLQLAMNQPCVLGVSNSTARDTRDVNVEGGVSSIINQSPPWFRGKYNPSKNLITFPNGSVIHTFSGEKPDSLRGYEFHHFWLDEFAKYKYPEQFFDQLMFCMRLPEYHQKLILTTTPRPIKTLISILDQPDTYVVKGSTYENKSNLSKKYLTSIDKRYKGTRLGRQEVNAEILTDTPGALWTYNILDLYRVTKYPELSRIVIAIDPATTSNTKSNLTGIIVCGVDDTTGIGYILEDASDIYSPNEWAEQVFYLYNKYNANMVVAEVNNGGDLVESNIQTYAKSQKKQILPVTKVHASKSKYARAEPISTLYTNGLVYHYGYLSELEDQLCTWVPGDESPDRLDALVWGCTYLLINKYEVTEYDIKW